MQNDTLYVDPDPPTWPNNGIRLNRWYRNLPSFIERLRRYHWVSGPWRFKYVQLRVDTRNGNFLLFDQDGKLASPDEMFPEGPPDRSELERALAYLTPHPSTNGPVQLTPAKMREAISIIRLALGMEKAA
jgi:hypothetical protein